MLNQAAGMEGLLRAKQEETTSLVENGNAVLKRLLALIIWTDSLKIVVHYALRYCFHYYNFFYFIIFAGNIDLLVLDLKFMNVLTLLHIL